MSILDDLLDRWEELRERGESISAEELCRDHPELLPEIRRQIKALEAVSLQFGSGLESASENAESIWGPSSNFELLNRYEIIKLHASGGLGHVYLAHDTVLDRPVAIKFLKRAELTKEQLDRFEWEARITGRLDHPGIVPIHSMQESENSTPCYVMRFINGHTLHQNVEAIWENNRSQPPHGYYQGEPLRELLRAFAAICNIVAYAHAQGVIHRDIKPGNIMLGPFGETLLLDWGIAKQFRTDSVDEMKRALPIYLRTEETDLKQLRSIANINSPTLTATGQAIGTPAYASPEQLRGLESASNPSTDLFSLGATLYFILSGRSPIEVFGWSTYLDQCSLPDSQLAASLPPKVPKALRAICNKAMRTQPQDRYAIAADLANDIQMYLSQEPVSVLPETWLARLSRFARKHPGLIGASVATTAVVMIAIIISSALVDAKNRRLEESAISLEQSLAKTQLANKQALAALRQMFDGVVVHHFAQREVMSEDDSVYLQKILQQYYDFANQQGDDIHARTIKAEANYRLADLLHRLNQKSDPIPMAKESVELYQQLCDQDKQFDLIDEYLEALRLLSETQVVAGENESGITNAKLGLSEFERTQELYSSSVPLQATELQASLHSIIAGGYTEQSEWSQAVASDKLSLAYWQVLLAAQPDKGRFKYKTAQTLGRLAESADHPEVECSPEQQLEYANQSVELARQYFELDHDIVESRIGYTNSLSARALAFLRQKKYEESTQDINLAIDHMDYLGQSFRSQNFNSMTVTYRLLKIRIRYEVNDWEGIIDQIDSLRPMSLNVDALSVCISKLTEYSQLFPEFPLALEWLTEMYWRRARLLSLEDKPQALSDRQSAIESLRKLIEQEPDETKHQINLVDALAKTAMEQARLGRLTSAQQLMEQARSDLLKLKSATPEQIETLQQLLTEAQIQVDGTK